jgi:hypothetical protein
MAALAGVLLLYRRWEPRGRGRLLLGALRWAAFLVILLLLFNPVVPRPAPAEPARVLLDGSLSMTTPERSGVTAWQEAVARARQLGVGDVLVFGGTPHPVTLGALPSYSPDASTSRLEPALRVAAEQGARRVLVVSDGRIADAAAAERLAGEMGIRLDMARVGGGAVDYGLAELEAPSWVEAGKPVTVRIGVVASDAAPDSALSVVLREDGRVVARGSVRPPTAGRVASLTFRFTPVAHDGLVRLEAELSGDDIVPDDDRRVAYLRVTTRPAAVLLSLHPDWEPRFLAPALQRALGLPVEGFLHVGGERYLRLGEGRDAGRPVAAGTVRRAVQEADFLIVHGMDDGAPDWVRRAVARARRLLVLPDTGAYSAAPVPLGRPAGGEWYPSNDVPASPVAPLLTGLSVGGLAPLTGPRLLRLPAGWWTPLVLRRGRRGVDAPMLAAKAVDGRRIAVVTAAGTWRWAFNGGAGTYDRVWSAMAGWLMGTEGPAEEPVRPANRVVARGAPVRWVAPGLALDSVAVRIGGSVSVADTVVRLVNDTATTRVLPPGSYIYAARGMRRDTVIASASGPFSVASYSREYAAPVVALQVSAGGGPTPWGQGLPLRAMAWPYVVLLLLLIVEWTLRRRWGLR